MERLTIVRDSLSNGRLDDLARRCKRAFERLKNPESEVRLPLFIEFAGSPKSGKTTIIGIVTHFLKRMGIQVAQPAEGASLRTPAGLRDDWLSFNTWSGCYALQNILIDCNQDPPVDVVILDRGLFDVAAWMEFLHSSAQRISEEDRDVVTRFCTLDLWRRRENAVFLFTADYATSLSRELDNKLTRQGGSVMNEDTLAELRRAYEAAATRCGGHFSRLYHVDTSFVGGCSPGFQQIAYVVADRIVDLIEELGTQMLLVATPVTQDGFVTDKAMVDGVIDAILRVPRFLDRPQAETAANVQQVVPYAVLRDDKNRYFLARRRHDVRRKELRRKWTILVGGHAEQRDWEGGAPAGVFERCLRREVEEELVGTRIIEIRRLGFVNDTRNAMGSRHLAIIHEIRVGGQTNVRRQALDQEFGRESVAWKTPEEIKASVAELDPWSQLVAGGLFDAPIPSQENDPTLFSS